MKYLVYPSEQMLHTEHYIAFRRFDEARAFALMAIGSEARIAEFDEYTGEVVSIIELFESEGEDYRKVWRDIIMDDKPDLRYLLRKELGWRLDDPELPVYIIGDGCYLSFDESLVSDRIQLDRKVDYWYTGQHERIIGDLSTEEMLVVSLYD